MNAQKLAAKLRALTQLTNLGLKMSLKSYHLPFPPRTFTLSMPLNWSLTQS